MKECLLGEDRRISAIHCRHKLRVSARKRRFKASGAGAENVDARFFKGGHLGFNTPNAGDVYE